MAEKKYLSEEDFIAAAIVEAVMATQDKPFLMKVNPRTGVIAYVNKEENV